MRLQENLSKLEEASNWISDRDDEWWPFLFVRPSPECALTSSRVLAIALLHGIPVGILAIVCAKLLGEPATSAHLIAFPAFTSFGVFVLYRTTFAYFWNRRAGRLRALEVRREAWRAGTREGDKTLLG